MPLLGGTSELRSTTPNWVPILAIRYLYWGYIWPQVSLIQRLTKCQADLKEYHSRPWDTSTREYVSSQVNQIQLCTTHGHHMPLLGICLNSGQMGPTLYHSWSLDATTRGTSELRSTRPKDWPNAKLTWSSTTLGHQMPLPGGTSELRSTRPNFVPLMATRCCYWWYIWAQINWTKCQADLK